MVCLRTFGTPHAHTCGYNLGFLRAIGFPFGGEGGRGVVEKRGKFVWRCILVTVANIRHVPKQPENMPMRYYKVVTYQYLCLCFQCNWAFEMECRWFRKCVAFITIFRTIRFAEDELCLYAVNISLLNVGTTSFNIHKQLSDAMYCLS